METGSSKAFSQILFLWQRAKKEVKTERIALKCSPFVDTRCPCHMRNSSLEESTRTSWKVYVPRIVVSVSKDSKKQISPRAHLAGSKDHFYIQARYCVYQSRLEKRNHKHSRYRGTHHTPSLEKEGLVMTSTPHVPLPLLSTIA